MSQGPKSSKVRPILFSAPMVRALLDGTKTQTRRVLRDDAWLDPELGVIRMVSVGPGVTGFQEVNCPYGKRGDHLWVREAWGYRCTSSTREASQYMHTIAYRADDARQTYGPMPLDGVGLPQQRERREGESFHDWYDSLDAYWMQWRPSIHMPRWASRITLEVTGVRVERLQDISRGDAMAEGCPLPNMARGEDPRLWYEDLWCDLNGKDSWRANPWVWVVEFRKATNDQCNATRVAAKD